MLFLASNYNSTLNRYLHPDVHQWRLHVLGLGGSISDSNLSKCSDLCDWAEVNGLRDAYSASPNHKLKFWLPLRTNGFAGFDVPIWSPRGYGARVTSVGFVSGDYSLGSLQGAKNKYLDSLCTSSDVAHNSVMFACQCNQDIAENASAAMGFSNILSNYEFSLWPRQGWGDANAMFTQNDTAGGPVSTSVGFFVAVRDTSDDCGLYQDATTIQERNVAPAVGSLASGIEIGLMTSRVFDPPGGNFTTYSTNRAMGGFFIGTGMTRTQAKSFRDQYLALAI